ncbi:BolA family protein [Psittacicella gerlachiana]|uniref:BolA family transcriptional regulator n=1 Tax=Psittacicella gerlachiana TaxID=2028574 RepID=A0A3A1Y2R8_9GAMM|nr:BolA family protein [Psittacicella gerlachiana]RIY31579.1 hypothetical protein CKF59_07555 [Psittacicella gerlachiana]
MFVHPHKLKIEEILTKEFAPFYLEVVDESYMHHGGPEAGSHYKVIMASHEFLNLKMVERHKKVHKVLHLVLNDIHALSLKLYTPEEWLNNPIVPASPKCMGKNK